MSKTKTYYAPEVLAASPDTLLDQLCTEGEISEGVAAAAKFRRAFPFGSNPITVRYRQLVKANAEKAQAEKEQA